MKKYWVFIFTILGFILLTDYYFTYPALLKVENVAIYLTIATFLFSSFAGFFIARQNSRLVEVRNYLARFDGDIGFILRSSLHLSKDLDKAIKKVISDHYSRALSFSEKSHHTSQENQTLKKLEDLVVKHTPTKLNMAQNQILNRTIAALLDAHTARKSLLLLEKERIPFLLWVLITILFMVLLFAIQTIPSNNLLAVSIIKSAFSIALFFVLFLLKWLNSLSLFEDKIGHSSAKDILRQLQK